MLQLELPSVEMMELLKMLGPTANKSGSPTPVTDRNVKVSFEFGQIFGTVIRSSCRQMSYVQYDDMPEELQGKTYLIPYKETVSALSLKSDTASISIHEDTVKTLVIKANKTVIKLTLEEENLFPKAKDVPTDISWTVRGDELKKLLSARFVYQHGNLANNNLIHVANLEDTISSYAFSGFVLSKINVDNDYHKKDAKVLSVTQEVASILRECIHDSFEVAICQEDEVGLSFSSTCIIANVESDGEKEINKLESGMRGLLTEVASAEMESSLRDFSESINLYNTLGYEDIGNRSIGNPVNIEIGQDGCYLVSNLEAYGTSGRIHIEGVCTGNANSKLSFGALKTVVQIFGRNEEIVKVKIFKNFAKFEHNNNVILISKMI